MKVPAKVTKVSDTVVDVDPRRCISTIHDQWKKSINVPTDAYIDVCDNWVSPNGSFPRDRISKSATADEIAIQQAYDTWSRMVYHLERDTRLLE